MHLCYIDESGNTGMNLNDNQQPLLVLTASLVPPDHVRLVEDELRELGYRYFAAEARNTDFEFHGDAIYNARGRYFKRLSLDKRIEILDSLVATALRHDCIKIGYVSIQKSGYYAKKHIQQTAFSLLVERLENYLDNTLNSYGLLVADEQDELEQRLIDDLDQFKQTGTHFGYKTVQVKRIIDSVHFVQSKNNPLMQLTDVLSYLICKGKESERKIHEKYALHRRGTEKPLDFKEWCSSYEHKGQRYFSATFARIRSDKSLVFSKDFPA